VADELIEGGPPEQRPDAQLTESEAAVAAERWSMTARWAATARRSRPDAERSGVRRPALCASLSTTLRASWA
jgi:hypothetical protein